MSNKLLKKTTYALKHVHLFRWRTKEFYLSSNGVEAEYGNVFPSLKSLITFVNAKTILSVGLKFNMANVNPFIRASMIRNISHYVVYCIKEVDFFIRQVSNASVM